MKVPWFIFVLKMMGPVYQPLTMSWEPDETFSMRYLLTCSRGCKELKFPSSCAASHFLQLDLSAFSILPTVIFVLYFQALFCQYFFFFYWIHVYFLSPRYLILKFEPEYARQFIFSYFNLFKLTNKNGIHFTMNNIVI